MCHFAKIACILMVISALISATPVRKCDIGKIMGDCEGISGRFLTYDNAHEISSLYIHDSDLSHLTDSDFTQFENLEKLTIDNCTFANVKQYRFLADLKYLERVTITNSDITGEFIFANGTDIRELSLQYNKLSRLSSDFFTHLKKVESVNLSHNYISDIAPDTFRNLTFLKKVKLTNNIIGESFDPLSLSRSPSLCSLCDGGRRENCSEGCHGNAEVGALWNSFGGSKVEVHLEGNPVCGALVDDPVSLFGRKGEVVRESEIEWHGSCQQWPAGRCPRHAKRHEFLRLSCVPEAHRTQTTVRPDGDDAVLSLTTRGVSPEGELQGKGAVPGDAQHAVTMGPLGIVLLSVGVVITLSVIIFLAVWVLPGHLEWVFCAKKADATPSKEEYQQITPHGDSERTGHLNTEV